KPAEMAERLAHDPPPLRARSAWKRRREVALGNPPMRPVQRVKREPQRAAAKRHERRRHEADDGDERLHGKVFETVAHYKDPGSPFSVLRSPFDSFWISQSRNGSAGSTSAVNGTDAIGSSRRSFIASRTASFSVVRTIAAADDFAPAAM